MVSDFGATHPYLFQMLVPPPPPRGITGVGLSCALGLNRNSYIQDELKIVVFLGHWLTRKRDIQLYACQLRVNQYEIDPISKQDQLN